MRCFYSPEYFLPLPEGHPFPMEKFADAAALLARVSGIELAPVPRLPRSTVERVHCPAYLDRVSSDDALGKAGLVPYARNRLGLPAHTRLLERSILETSGTVAATTAALEEGAAANLAGGTHHAFRDRGAGYCVLNDVVVAIRDLQCRRPETQILVIDTDAHQGNGTHALLAGDPFAKTYSIHVGPNYPSEKVPGTWDVGLPRYATAQAYLEALAATLEPAFAETEPDLVFWISGADPHENDRFGQLLLSADALAERDYHVLSLINRYSAPWVTLFGGGYNRAAGMTGKLHAASVERSLRAHQAVRPSSAVASGLHPTGGQASSSDT